MLNWPYYSPLIIWLVVVSLEPFRHLYIITHKRVSPDKFKSLAARCLIATALGIVEVIDLDKWWLQMFLTYLTTGWFIHNTILGLGLGHKPWYLNDSGPLDRHLKDFAPYFWVCLGLAAMTLAAMYFVNE
jgi:hypothetical protein